MSDTTSIISSNERNSEISLPPHYLQETPPLFDNTYMMYNPKNDKSFEPSLSENFGFNYGCKFFSDVEKYTLLAITVDHTVSHKREVKVRWEMANHACSAGL